MNLKRILTSLIGLPLVIILLVFGNKYIVDVAISIVAIICLSEYFNAIGGKSKNLKWLTYIMAVLIAFIHIIPMQKETNLISIIIPLSVLGLFAYVIFSNMKYNINDIALCMFAICYVVIFLMFLPIIRNMENGKITIWFVFFSAWGTDTAAYLIGKKFGKHKFSQISPNKSIEGCIAGLIGATLLSTIYTLICNRFLGMDFNYFYIIIIAILLSAVGQLGDFAASSIKRYFGIKDFSNLIPGHGGMIDRMDSVIFIAPVAYFLLTLI